MSSKANLPIAPITDQEREVLRLFRLLSPRDQQHLLRLLDALEQVPE
ncbi:hypothetical protein 3S12_29 [uncultured Caudovirales phage]|uniref:Uncharacterized protein n=1 Tax=uncultured Caudovirales phage TaxID=2100421 RepID=A0A2H4JGL1_9CAUD|nr:hypothetical protein 3S12_29 [uncultured Caudovirales phage]